MKSVWGLDATVWSAQALALCTGRGPASFEEGSDDETASFHLSPEWQHVSSRLERRYARTLAGCRSGSQEASIPRRRNVGAPNLLQRRQSIQSAIQADQLEPDPTMLTVPLTRSHIQDGATPSLRPIVFLDIDDVICRCRPYGGADVLQTLRHGLKPPADLYQEIFHAVPRQVIAAVWSAMNTEVDVVISSTWRLYFRWEELASLFRATELEFLAQALLDESKWCTPSFAPPATRRDEILAWLRRHHEGQPFVILDDLFSGGSLLHDSADDPLHGRIVLCEQLVGLEDRHLGPILQALRTPTSATSFSPSAHP